MCINIPVFHTNLNNMRIIKEKMTAGCNIFDKFTCVGTYNVDLLPYLVHDTKRKR